MENKTCNLLQRDINKQGVRARVFSSRQDRENTCQLCQMDHTIVMKDIKIEKGIKFYLTSLRMFPVKDLIIRMI